MTTYTYLGYGTTDSNGVAKLDHDANGDAIDHSYTGTGAGEIDVVASLDKPIASGSVVSQPYSIWDTVFHLECTSETNNWSYNDARVSASFSDDGVHFTGLENTSFKQVSLTNNGARFLDGTKDTIIEYDIKKTTIVRLGIIDNGTTTRQILSLGSSYGTDWNHIKLVYNATTHKITPYVNGTALTDVDLSSYTMTTFGITFLDDTANTMDFYIKNIKIYYG